MDQDNALLELEQAAKSPLGPLVTTIADPEPAEGQNSIHATPHPPCMNGTPSYETEEVINFVD
jgi:hypothetical protein